MVLSPFSPPPRTRIVFFSAWNGRRKKKKKRGNGETVGRKIPAKEFTETKKKFYLVQFS